MLRHLHVLILDCSQDLSNEGVWESSQMSPSYFHFQLFFEALSWFPSINIVDENARSLHSTGSKAWALKSEDLGSLLSPSTC